MSPLETGFFVSKELSIGDLVVANGKLATVSQLLPNGFISAVYRSTGESAVVDARHVENIETTERAITQTPGYTSLVEGYSSAELSVAAQRFDTIRRWKNGSITRAQASTELDISEHHLYKIAKSYDAKLGSMSLLQNKRGRKQGVTLLAIEVESIIHSSTDKTYKSRAASYRKVWKDVDIECQKKGLATPSKKTVTRRIKAIKSEKERDIIKFGADAASQKHSPRPGKKIVTRPLEWV